MTTLSFTMTTSFSMKKGLAIFTFPLIVLRDSYPIIGQVSKYFGCQFQGAIVENRVTELALAEFLSYGPQKHPGSVIIFGPSHLIR